jgi:hypothetical protein
MFGGNPEIGLCTEHEIGVFLGDDSVHRKWRPVRW